MGLQLLIFPAEVVTPFRMILLMYFCLKEKIKMFSSQFKKMYTLRVKDKL